MWSVSTSRLALIVAITALIAAGLGYVAGRSFPPTLVTHIGIAGPAENAISVEADGWTYNIPLDITWIDDSGSRHDSGRPECLPPDAGNVEIAFTSIDAPIGGEEWRPVVLVDCRHAVVMP